MKLFAAILLPAVLLSVGFAAEYDEDIDENNRDLANYWTGPYQHAETPWWYRKFLSSRNRYAMHSLHLKF